jgi:type III restriction enzyme
VAVKDKRSGGGLPERGIWRRATTVVRYDMTAGQMHVVSTKNRPEENASAAQLRRDRVAFIPRDTRDSVDEEQLEFFDEVTEEGGPYRHVAVKNRLDLKTPMSMVFTDAGNEKRFVEGLLDASNLGHIDAWLKSDSMRFYSIDYAWRKGEHPKRGKFNPDFFIKTGDRVIVAEVKGNEALRETNPENEKKLGYARAHFKRLNAELARKKNKRRYFFHFLALSDFPDFFDALREGRMASYASKLDVKLEEQQGEM